jgi:hypothetical protein
MVEAMIPRKTFMLTVRKAIRRVLSLGRRSRSSPYRSEPHTARLSSGLDHERMNSLCDELEDAAILERLRSR